MSDHGFLEDNLGTLTTTGGTDLGRSTAVAPEALKRARQRIDVQLLYDAVLQHDRTLMARAITLLESTAPAHRALAQELLVKLLPHSGNALRIGITGVPGVGKSTFIEAFGLHLIEQGHKVAVVAIDPSSTKTRGSILGDKTRMSKLSNAENAFIRPSPSAGTLGGVAKATREAWWFSKLQVTTSSSSKPSASAKAKSPYRTWWISSPSWRCPALATNSKASKKVS